MRHSDQSSKNHAPSLLPRCPVLAALGCAPVARDAETSAVYFWMISVEPPLADARCRCFRDAELRGMRVVARWE